MAYSIFEKKATRIATPSITITPFPRSRLVLNAASTKIFHENAVELVLMLWDADACKLGLRPISKRDTRAYKVTYAKKSLGCSFAVRSFLNHIGWEASEKVTADAEWDTELNMFEITLPKTAIRDQKQRKLLRLDGDRKQKTAV